MSASAGLTPALQQYVDMKRQHSDCILFFRMGDFYETFFEDAVVCSKVLDIVLTSRNKNSENAVPMAGIPYHSSEKYIQKLIHNGYKVAIAEQMSAPQAGKIVERKVTSIITPGTFLSETHHTTNTMLALVERNGHIHCARGDFTQGRYKTQSFSQIGDALKHIFIILPNEIIIDSEFKNKQLIHDQSAYFHQPLISLYHLPAEPERLIQQTLRIHTLASFGEALKPGRLEAFALLVNYLSYTQQSQLYTVTSVSAVTGNDAVLMDDVTIKNLEIYTANYDQSKKYSLFGVLDCMQTQSGSTLLRELIINPTQNTKTLQDRYDHIDYYIKHHESTHILRKHLSHFSDIQKLVSILMYKKMSASGFGKLRTLCGLVFDSQQTGAVLLYEELLRLGLKEDVLTTVKTFWQQLQKILKAEILSDELDYIQDGISDTIDELRTLAYNSDELLVRYQQEIVKHTGISSIKLKFILNQGYALEVTNKDIETLEKKSVIGDEKLEFQRRQTLKGGQRYSSVYLDDLQKQILGAREKLIREEKEFLHQLLEQLKECISALAQLCEHIARCDLYTGQAHQAMQKRYCKPQLTKESVLQITGARHPVIEEHLPTHEQFISNDLEIGITTRRGGHEQGSMIHIITGPNMGGKSTYLRQNALCVLMAQCGLRVPADKMVFRPCDGIFARVGTGDHIAKRQSTFMTEMVEVSSILHHATANSFIIFDELGRGTSTYDGMALSRSIIVYILEKIKAKTLLATHYHELIALEKKSALIQNFSVGVYETEKEIVFLKKIVAGGANKSYGIDVASLAGLPREIIEHAKHTLEGLSQHEKSSSPQSDTHTISKQEKKSDTDLFGDHKQSGQVSDAMRRKVEKINYFLAGIDIHHCTPLQALQFLAKIKDEWE